MTQEGKMYDNMHPISQTLSANNSSRDGININIFSPLGNNQPISPYNLDTSPGLSAKHQVGGSFRKQLQDTGYPKNGGIPKMPVTSYQENGPSNNIISDNATNPPSNSNLNIYKRDRSSSNNTNVRPPRNPN